MTREEYDERKRRLDEQLRDGVELLETAHRQQLRALDLVWMTTAEGDVALPRLPAPAKSVAAKPVAAPQRPSRRAAWQLYEEVKAALAQVPEVFDRNQVCQALGYEPDRGSLFRTFRELVREGVLAVQAAGAGKTPTRYRKLRVPSPPSAG